MRARFGCSPTARVNHRGRQQEQPFASGFISIDEILWVSNAYGLLFAALLITSGRLDDIFGPKRLFDSGMALFTVASAFSGLAQDPTQQIIARALQGVGGALMSPQPIASIFPPAQAGRGNRVERLDPLGDRVQRPTGDLAPSEGHIDVWEYVRVTLVSHR